MTIPPASEGGVTDAPPVVIVAGFVLCGLATTMAMLEAGGLQVAGGAHAPTYEIPQTAHRIDAFVRGVFGPYGVADEVLKQLPQPIHEMGGALDAAWFKSLHGQAVKLVNPHLMKPIPCGNYRVIWLDRDELERARAWLEYVGAPTTGMFCHIIQNYFTTNRSAARSALLDAGGTILDIQHRDLFGDHDHRVAVIDRIVDFLGMPLDRAAMLARSMAPAW